MAKKRGNNEGSVFKRNNGTWCAQVSLKGKRISRTFKTQKEGQIWIRETSNRIDTGLRYENVHLTLEDFLERWLRSSKSSLNKRVWAQYSQIARDYILPELGQRKLVDLHPSQIQALYDKHLASGVGVRTVQYVHSILRSCLFQAVKLGVLQKNPVIVTSPPRSEYKEMQVLNEKEAQLLLTTSILKEDRYAALYNLALTTGMRQGELLGLKWEDINWERKTLHIQRQLSRAPNGALKLTRPKTRGSIRTISIGAATISILKEHQRQQYIEACQKGTAWKELDLVFPTSVGTPTNHGNLLRRSFKPLLDDAGLPEIRFHDLRHTAASLMLNHGVHVLIVSKRLGHAKPSITLDVYGHIMSGMQEEAANIMDDIITPIDVADKNLVATGCNTLVEEVKQDQE
jgi:integrase